MWAEVIFCDIWCSMLTQSLHADQNKTELNLLDVSSHFISLCLFWLILCSHVLKFMFGSVYVYIHIHTYRSKDSAEQNWHLWQNWRGLANWSAYPQRWQSWGVYTYIYIYILANIHAYMYCVYLCIYIHVFINTYMYICICTCVYKSVEIYMYMFTHTHVPALRL